MSSIVAVPWCVEQSRYYVQGFEAGVLRGASRLLGRVRPISYFECQTTLAARAGTAPSEKRHASARLAIASLQISAVDSKITGKAVPGLVN